VAPRMPPLLEPGDVRTAPGLARPLAVAAIRELFEETGLALGHPDPGAPALAPRAPATLRPMLEAGLLPMRPRERFGLYPEKLVADTAYGSASSPCEEGESQVRLPDGGWRRRAQLSGCARS
jgi:8-oxo-dGTP pyrophosphatase MutT (NUDIX family)